MDARDWVALPEILRGRHLLADLGWISATREQAIAAGVLGLARPRGEGGEASVALPAVVLKMADGTLRMFRLPASYAAAVKRLARLDDRVWEDRRPQPPLRLPCHFVIGDEESVYLFADGQSQPN